MARRGRKKKRGAGRPEEDAAPPAAPPTDPGEAPAEEPPEEPGADSPGDPRRLLVPGLLLLLLPALLLARGVLGFHRFAEFEEGAWTPTRIHYTGFVQDDAFISLRYAWNFAQGHGLVFNPGTYTEGYTNLLWTVLGGVALKLGLPALRVWQALGVVAALALLVGVLVLGTRLAGVGWGLAAAVLLACSPTLHAWAASGMESAFFSALLLGALVAAELDRVELAFGLLGAAQWTRPETPLAAGALIVVLVRHALAEGAGRDRVARLARAFLFYLGPTLALLAWRYGYYGRLLPNTYLVKAGGNAPSHLLGLRKLEDLALFNGNLVVWVFALLALVPDLGPDPEGRPRREPWWWRLAAFAAGAALFFTVDVYLNDQGFWRGNTGDGTWSVWKGIREGDYRLPWALLSAAIGGTGVAALVAPGRLLRRPTHLAAGYIWLGYLYYFVRIGGDLLPMHRLFLPAMALQSLLAALGARRAAGPDGIGGWLQRAWPGEERAAEVRGGGVALFACALLGVAGTCMVFSSKQGHYQTVTDALDSCHGQVGRDLEAIAGTLDARPRVLAQDMGLLPMSAPGCDFLDAIGLTERPVAEILFAHDYSPYFRYLVWDSKEHREDIREMEGELREHLTRENPDYVVINAHLKNKDVLRARDAVRDGDGEFFQPFLVENSFFYRWPETAFFRENYVYVKAYEYSHVHYMVLLRRKDMPGLPGG